MKKSTILALVVAALGYFVDIYDLILFSVVRVPSLRDLGVTDSQMMDDGLLLLNLQMVGMIIGGITFGILGDKLGRLKVLFGSILLYSIANLANAFVTTTEQYAVLRLIAGIGLAGELGAGITLVSEVLPKHLRGFGTTIVASIGVSGALFAWYVAEHYQWRTSFIVGGVMGLMLLFLRVGVIESGIFESAKKNTKIAKGNFLMLFQNKKRFERFLVSIAIGVPIWYVIGILITLSPEIRAAQGPGVLVVAGKAVFYAYSGLILGDLASGLLSQYLQSRRKSVLVFLFITTFGVGLYFGLPQLPVESFYLLAALLGFGSGYWAMFVTIAAEQFGTNMRATVATSVPNFVRGSLVPMSLMFSFFKDSLGVVHSSLLVGIFALLIAFWGYIKLQESFHKDLDFVEE